MFLSPPTSVSWHLTNTTVLHLESRDKEVMCTPLPIHSEKDWEWASKSKEGSVWGRGKTQSRTGREGNCVKGPGRQGLYCRAELYGHVLQLSTDDRMITDGSGEIGCNRISVSWGKKEKQTWIRTRPVFFPFCQNMAITDCKYCFL